MTLTPLQTALESVNGRTITYGPKKWRLECWVTGDRFFCCAHDLRPFTDEERKFCILDLWHSATESQRAINILFKFAKLGGYDLTRPHPAASINSDGCTSGQSGRTTMEGGTPLLATAAA